MSNSNTKRRKHKKRRLLWLGVCDAASQPRPGRFEISGKLEVYYTNREAIKKLARFFR